MEILRGRMRSALICEAIVLAAQLGSGTVVNEATAAEPAKAATIVSPPHFPTVPPEHSRARTLLENAVGYVGEGNKMIDPASGYPFEGWNHDHTKGLYLRAFTQLTAIGEWMEVLANVVAGQADTHHLSRPQALSYLDHLVKSLRQDQHDPRLSARGLIVNFLDLASGMRLSPLTSDVEKHKVLDVLGPQKGEAVWKALKAKGWIVPRGDDLEAGVVRNELFGANHFDGPMAPYADAPTKQKIMDLLDQRVVMIVFGDNANLSSSAAKTIGALLLPEIKDQPGVAAVRLELEQFLDDQKEGYAQLYDAKTGLFNFGWNATRDRLFGWEDPQGNWVTGHMDYLVNEFRGPTTFVVLRYGLPHDAVANLGFKMKPYRMRDGKDVYVLAPWEGSAFQALGLGLSIAERKSPSWRGLLQDIVDVEIDYSARKRLPGFLSESYTGNGVEYSGAVGIPEITVSPQPRITDAASLYTLGIAYSIAPKKVELFLAENWPIVSTLLTDHGPWEGFNTTRQEVIRFQTTAHTLSLILGMLNTGSDHMIRYLEMKGLGPGLAEVYKTGDEVDLLAEGSQAFAWANKGSVLQSAREGSAFGVKSDRADEVGIAFVTSRPTGVNLSGGVLTLRYRSSEAIGEAIIGLKPVANVQSPSLIAKEIFTQLVETGGRDAEVRVPLPASPGLTRIKEVVLTFGRGSKGKPVDLSVSRFVIEKR